MVSLLHAAASFWTHDLWHPLTGPGYQWWSGAGSDIGEVTLIIGLGVYLKKHNCHVSGCWRLAWHPHRSHEHPVCKRHYYEDGATHGLQPPH